ncbi:ABC transporter ATP-binding protein [Candidatus Enterococcus murrayae]|uniref:ABC transporter ATP-binding protein n=1 Tax=Candidatus Enterococcus murrayae TaxID=2815321 RepID=A0ABS3HQP6_9ENTE|nr:ABC transporter ATP-binding protein [Enterococcus sp. MJM16]MBO0454908.1 ABC transporter ATP-binding protein [Enterococcus sp. MJM16]
MKDYYKNHKLLLFFTLVFGALSSIASVGIALLLQMIVDFATSGEIQRFPRVILIALSYFLALGICKFIYSYLNKLLINKIIIEMRRDIFSGILRLDDRESDIGRGKYHSLLITDIQQIEENYLMTTFIIFENATMFLISLVVFLKTSILITAFMIFALLLTLLVPSILSKKLENTQRDFSSQSGKFSADVKDFVDGLEVIRSYRLDNFIKNKFNSTNQKLARSSMKSKKIFAISESLSEVLGLITITCSVLLSSYFVITGKFTMGTLVALIQLSSSMLNPVMMLIQSIPKALGMKNVISNLNDITSIGKEESKDKNLVVPFENSISLENVEYSYDDNCKVIDSFSAQFNKNKKYAIVGKSGSGKSTLLNLISGLLVDYNGNISIDDVPIREISSKSLLSNISYVHQDIYLFNSSIKENIVLDKQEDHNKLNAILKTSGLIDYVESLKNGINTLVGEHGNQISGGQRQRIAIARALYQDSSVIMMDEGTSSLDIQTSWEVENNLMMNKNLTIISVIHKLDEKILSLYDEIIFLEKGRIKARGTYDRIINDENFQLFMNI